MYNIEELHLSDPLKCEKVYDTVKCLILHDATIERIKRVFISEMQLALNEQASSLQMENTYIPELPDGTEDGVYLALDLGGTNFRVILIELHDGNIINENVQHYHIADHMREGCGEPLFNYLAQCVDDFAKQNNLADDITYPLGFTFSFPMRQYSLDSGYLVTWTKTFNCPSVVGVDVVQKLRTSLTKYQRRNIEVLAILNDTTGTLVQGARLDPHTRVGIVLGTGSNGCYMESAENVCHWETKRHDERHVIIDVEWGALGDNGVLDFIRTEFDRKLDNSSLLRNSFTFEKYIGGKFLGELFRLVLHRLHVDGLFLRHRVAAGFPEPWSFGSDNLSKIEQDIVSGTGEHLVDILADRFACRRSSSDYTKDDLAIIRYVSGLVSRRAAQLVAINTTCLVNRMAETEITVAIDGSVYKHHPRLRHWISEYTKLWSPNKECKFMLAEDGSGKGAALVAAIAKKLKLRLEATQ